MLVCIFIVLVPQRIGACADAWIAATGIAALGNAGSAGWSMLRPACWQMKAASTVSAHTHRTGIVLAQDDWRPACLVARHREHAVWKQQVEAVF